MTAVAILRQAQNDVVTLALREIRSFWRTLDFDNPVAAVLALEEFLPVVVQEYGELGATAAADFYEELREASPAARKAYNALLAEPPNVEQIRKSAKWTAGPLFKQTAEGHLFLPAPEPEKALARVIDITDRFIKQQARDTVTLNVERDPARARFARVPSGATTCAFCMMLAGRGAVYASGRSAGYASQYHGHCDCVPTPVWDDTDLDRIKAENNYDPDSLRGVYEKAKRNADSDSLKGEGGILAAMREQSPEIH